MPTRTILGCVLVLLAIAGPIRTASAEDDKAADSQAATEAWEIWQQGDLERALQVSARAVAQEGTSPYAWTVHGFLLSQAGRKEEALSAYEHAETLAPGDATVLNNLGTILLEFGRLDEAETRFQRALHIRPGYADALNNLGVVQERRGRDRQAAATYERAVRADPKHARAQTNLGALALKRGEVESARERFHRANAMDPSLGAPRLNLLLLETQGSRDAGGLERLSRVAHDPSEPATVRAGALSALAARAVAAEEFEKARALYLEALELTPADADLLNNTAVAEDQLGLHRDAMLHLEAAMRARPGSMVARNNVGIVLVHRGSWDLAESVFRDIIERDPNFHRAHYNLGVSLAAQGRQPEALASFERAAALAPMDAAVHYNLGVIRRQLGGTDESELRSYERALEIDPDLVEAHLSIGCFLADPQTRQDLRDEKRAREHLLRFLELCLPDDEDGRTRAQAWLDWLNR